MTIRNNNHAIQTVGICMHGLLYYFEYYIHGPLDSHFHVPIIAIHYDTYCAFAWDDYICYKHSVNCSLL